MKIIAQLMDGEGLSIMETTTILELKDEEPKIQIQPLGNMPSLEEKGEESISNIIEVDVHSAVEFKGLNIVRVLWVGNTMCVYFDIPTDIAIIDEEYSVDVPFEPLETPLRCITVTDLTNFEPSCTVSDKSREKRC
jgi:hypothetical protein